MPHRTFDSVLCFGDSDWWYHNRGHADMQFMRRFARLAPTLYVNSLGVSLPRRDEGRMFLRKVGRKLSSVLRYCRDGGEGFRVFSPIYLSCAAGLRSRLMNGFLRAQLSAVLKAFNMRRPLIWVACPTAAVALDGISHAGLVYQLSDCYSAIGGGTSSLIEQRQHCVAERADLVLCASDQLLSLARTTYAKGDYLDHGVDYDLFASAAADAAPPELAGIRHPLIGFFGNIDSNTIDRELLDGVIQRRPALTFALVGPMADDFRCLTRHPNVIAIPRRPYGEIARYGAAFDVCLMPWLQNDWIAHCNPVKLKEYLALGKPIVTTSFPELRRYSGLYYEATGVDSFADAIDRALVEDCTARQRQRQAMAAMHTWDAKFERVLELLEQRNIYVDGHTK